MRKMLAALILVLLLVVWGCGGSDTTTTTAPPTETTAAPATETTAAGPEAVKIGIIQIVEHPALDAARLGFLAVLAENGYVEGENLTVDYQNAQGDMSTASAIAQKFAADKVDLILAIATPTAQAAASATTDIPILITAVTDPVAAKLVNSLDVPGTNVSGTTDMNPVEDQLKLLREVFPGAKNVGIIYNSSEVNSVVQVDLAKAAAADLGLTIVEAVATTSSEVLQAAQSLVGRVDSLYVPGDNTVVTALESVLKVAQENKLPVVSADTDSVKRGAIATLGIDYELLGRQTGEMALRVFAGEDVSTMPIEAQQQLLLTVNPAGAEAMGITVPQALLDRADEVIK